MKIFESRPFYVLAISSLLCFCLLIFLTPFNLQATLIYAGVFVTPLTFLRKLEFFEGEICRNYLFIPKWPIKKKCFQYHELYLVEVRRIFGTGNMPYVILHFSPKQVNSNFFTRRSFIYKNISELDPLMIHLVKKEIPISIKISSEYRKDKIHLIEILKEHNGKYTVCNT